MKVVLVNSLYAPYRVGGAERSVEMLAQGLLSEGVQVSVISLHDGKGVVRELRDGVDVWRLPLRNSYWPFDLAKRSPVRRLIWHIRDIYNWRALSDILAALEVIKPDVVHTNNLAGFSVSAWDAAGRYGVPLVHTARDYYLLHPNSTLYAKGRVQDESALVPRLWAFLKRRVQWRVDCFVSISSYVRDIHLRNGHFPVANSTVIHNSVELPESVPQRELRQSRALKLGFIGRLDPSKGVELLIDVAARLPDVIVLIAGDGRRDYVEKLKSIAPGNVVFLGRTEPAELFACIDPLVVPSVWAEPLGRVVLEAYAYGMPVLASRLGGLTDVVEDGVSGWYFDVASPESLESAIRQIQRADIEAMRVACLARSAEFSLQAIAERYLSVYQDAVQVRLPETEASCDLL
ncbi:TPA: glycosyltransferase family 4 protein [Stenotrophomonas maltophilia]|nr:glycosyltransferase family 4 protein [Stenotrophomonas maltophilia]HDS1171387.1 glycosyltransferase family 4 protein [Stenotrophomonas maltophilia]